MDNLTDEQSEEKHYKVAVASSDGIVVNQHFGRADTFYIYEVAETGQCRQLETRTVTPICNRGEHDDNALQDNMSKFQDCRYLLVSRIGTGAANAAEQLGITPMELPGMIEESIGRVITYKELQNLL